MFRFQAGNLFPIRFYGIFTSFMIPAPMQLLQQSPKVMVQIEINEETNYFIAARRYLHLYKYTSVKIILAI